jgi:hypothetical protein
VRPAASPEEAPWSSVRLEDTRLVIENLPLDAEVLVTPQ